MQVYRRVTRNIGGITLTKLVADDSMTNSEREAVFLQERQRLLEYCFGKDEEGATFQLNFGNTEAMRKGAWLNSELEPFCWGPQPFRSWKHRRANQWRKTTFMGSILQTPKKGKK